MNKWCIWNIAVLYCRAKPPVCCLPKMFRAWITSNFFLHLSVWAIRFFNSICFVLYSCFVSPLLYSTFLSSSVWFFSTPWSFSFSLSLCTVPFSLITLAHTLHSFPFFAAVSLCIFNPFSCVFFCLSLLFLPHFLALSHSFCLTHTSFFPQLECDNFITVIQKVNDTFIVCGTNAGSPRCWMLVRVSYEKFLERLLHVLLQHWKHPTFIVCCCATSPRAWTVSRSNAISIYLFTRLFLLMVRWNPGVIYCHGGCFHSVINMVL